MKAIVATKYGAPDVLQLQEVVKPTPKDNEILVKVHASSATTADGMMRTGKPYFGRLLTGITKPKNPITGTGFAGVVESAGKEVTLFKAGDEVFGETALGFGANAEYVVVPENGVITEKPEDLSFAEAAPLCDGALTSMNFLKNLARIKPGQSILIIGASGSLGTSAVQLAKAFGAEVTGVCSTSNVNMVTSLGADKVIDYSKEDFTKNGEVYDIIYDTIGKSSFTRVKRSLATEGLYISPVLGFKLLLQMAWTSITKQVKKAKFSATGLLPHEELRFFLEELKQLISQKQLKSVIDKQYPLEEVAVAHDYIRMGHKKGNVVISH